ncbi:hypothetical protein LTR84_011774 [Exophiala bonariae]|uniref:Uncharacterized protein n=1 Tax=Exophiala bonariae TaxID=1690606 RepID=A0AAV9NKL0_9EURO|nr:hypothetical protein LTR84_011774 [Exophiala bonariae]
MADTRCVDSGLQLDVDLMILEYTLYQATKARLEALQAETGHQKTDSTRQILIFETVLRLFNTAHSKYIKTKELLFNIKILELLVLVTAGSAEDLTESHVRDLKKEASENRTRRQRWAKLRRAQVQQPGAVPTPSQNSLTHIIECQIYGSWDSQEPQGGVLHDDLMGTLFGLLPRFMEISAEMASIAGEPNAGWARIASEFMLQASLECLRSKMLTGTSGGPSLEECFAWGFINDDDDRSNNDISQRQQDLEIAIKELFRRESEYADEILQEEKPMWTDIRHQYLSEFSISDDASANSQDWRLERLTAKYPPADFQDTLVDYIESVWENHNEAFGLPILVEIEQGHIKSLNIEEKDFDEFMSKVGLRKNSSNVLTFNFTGYKL